MENDNKLENARAFFTALEKMVIKKSYPSSEHDSDSSKSTTTEELETIEGRVREELKEESTQTESKADEEVREELKEESKQTESKADEELFGDFLRRLVVKAEEEKYKKERERSIREIEHLMERFEIAANNGDLYYVCPDNDSTNFSRYTIEYFEKENIQCIKSRFSIRFSWEKPLSKSKNQPDYIVRRTYN